MKRSFEVVAFRHGDKDGKELSAFGVQQVEASAHTHMGGTPFVLAFSSGMPRAPVRSCSTSSGRSCRSSRTRTSPFANGA